MRYVTLLQRFSSNLQLIEFLIEQMGTTSSSDYLQWLIIAICWIIILTDV